MISFSSFESRGQEDDERPNGLLDVDGLGDDNGANADPSFSIAREWTNWADPSLYESLQISPSRLDIGSLLELGELLRLLTVAQECQPQGIDK